VAAVAAEEGEIASKALSGAPPAPAAAPVEAPKPTVSRPASPDEALRTIDVLSAPRNERDRQERCADLLQEATLRRLGTAESTFFKKECR